MMSDSGSANEMNEKHTFPIAYHPPSRSVNDEPDIVTVQVEIDPRRIAEALVDRAMRHKSKVASTTDGFVVVTILEKDQTPIREEGNREILRELRRKLRLVGERASDAQYQTTVRSAEFEKYLMRQLADMRRLCEEAEVEARKL
jgi:hypothetical protein